MSLFGLLYAPMKANSQSFRFVDEEEHIVVGKLMSQGYQLYEDVSTNHQPYNYLLSEVIHRTQEMPNIFMLLLRHRQVVFGLSLVGAVFLGLRFGWVAVPIVAMTELTKMILLGNLFVAESLVVYPLIYLFGSFLELGLFGRWYREDFLLGIASGLVVLTLLPVAPVVLLLFLYRYVVYRCGKMRWFLLGSIVTVVLCFQRMSLIDYVRETIWNNVIYAMPRLSEVHTAKDVLQLITYPIWWIRDPDYILSIWLAVLVVMIGVSAYVIGRSRSRKLILTTALGILVWVLANTRVIRPAVAYYEGFHLLPWWVLGITLAFFLTARLRTMSHRAYATMIGLVGVVGVYMLLGTETPVTASKNPMEENYIQYNLIQQTTEMLEIIAEKHDRMIVLPNDAILHITSGIPPAINQVTYYEWQYYPRLHAARFNRLMSLEPPEIVYFVDDDSAYARELRPILETRYVQLSSAHPLFVLDQKYLSLDADMWKALLELPFAESIRDTTSSL